MNGREDDQQRLGWLPERSRVEYGGLPVDRPPAHRSTRIYCPYTLHLPPSPSIPRYQAPDAVPATGPFLLLIPTIPRVPILIVPFLIPFDSSCPPTPLYPY